MTTQVHEVYIKATPQAIWDAFTKPEWTTKYGYAGPVDYYLRPGGRFQAHATPPLLAMGMPDVVVDGEVLESVPPHRLVQTYRFLFNAQTRSEGFTGDLGDREGGVRLLEATRDARTGRRAHHGGHGRQPVLREGTGGWTWILSDLKSVLETGSRM